MNNLKTGIGFAVTVSTVLLFGCSTARDTKTGEDASRPSATSDAGSAGQWNIMVVPSRQTAFSSDARTLFNQNCASCHSRDGQAQTPIAKQRHVQDLSECKLADDGIIEQILEGTHHKTNLFKMPSFRGKLTRAAIESLVPLVKAFRPVPLSFSDSTSGEHRPCKPRLVGILSFPGRKYAVLEKVPFSGRYFILAESESHDGISLDHINSKKGSVQLWVVGTKPIVTLNLNRRLLPSRTGNAHGFAGWIAGVFNDSRHELTLEQASSDLVLFLYAQFTGRTLLRSPRVPSARFSLGVSANNPASIALHLQAALAAEAITVIPDGNKFLLVVPTTDASRFGSVASEFKSPTGAAGGPELFPGGAIINLPNSDLAQVASLYADVTGRPLDRTQQPPSASGHVTFTTQSPLNTQECIYALETLLRWHGLKVFPAGGDCFRIDMCSEAKR